MKKSVFPVWWPRLIKLRFISEGETYTESATYFCYLLVDGLNEVTLRTLSREMKDYIGLPGQGVPCF